jgi:hypothetical protein
MLIGPVAGAVPDKFAGQCPSVRASSRFSQAAGGVLTGPRPAPAAGLGRAGRPGDSDYSSAGAAGRTPRIAEAGRREPAPV